MELNIKYICSTEVRLKRFKKYILLLNFSTQLNLYKNKNKNITSTSLSQRAAKISLKVLLID